MKQEDRLETLDSSPESASFIISFCSIWSSLFVSLSLFLLALDLLPHDFVPDASHFFFLWSVCSFLGNGFVFNGSCNTSALFTHLLPLFTWFPSVFFSRLICSSSSSLSLSFLWQQNCENWIYSLFIPVVPGMAIPSQQSINISVPWIFLPSVGYTDSPGCTQ